MNIKPKDVFAALSHETRLRCLILLLRHDELCVCELTYAIEQSQPHISRNLAQLRESGLVTDRRQGLWIHYRINPDLPQWLHRVLDETYAGIHALPPYTEDEQALNAMPNRPGAPRCA